MKFRYLIFEIDNVVVSGSNKEPPADMLEDDFLLIVDTATDQQMDPYKGEWKAIKEVTFGK